MKKDIKTIKMNQSEIKNTKSEMKNILEGINNRLVNTEQISNLEDRIVSINSKMGRKKMIVQGSSGATSSTLIFAW